MRKKDLLDLMNVLELKKLNDDLVFNILSEGEFRFYHPDLSRDERTTIGVWTSGDGFEITATASSIAIKDFYNFDVARTIIEDKIKVKIYELYGFYLMGEL